MNYYTSAKEEIRLRENFHSNVAIIYQLKQNYKQKSSWLLQYFSTFLYAESGNFSI
jgi:hypothetical protein